MIYARFVLSGTMQKNGILNMIIGNKLISNQKIYITIRLSQVQGYA